LPHLGLFITFGLVGGRTTDRRAGLTDDFFVIGGINSALD
jgi:hypothetical protein